MKKILYVSTHPHLNLSAPSGPGTHMREVISALKKKGCEVHTFIAGGETLQEGNNAIHFSKKVWKKFIPKFVWESMKELRLMLHNRKMIQRIEQVIDEVKPDVIYERGYAFMTATSIVAKQKNIPLFLELNAPYPEEIREMSGAGLFHRFSKVAEKKQVALASHLVVVSSALRDYFIEKYNASASKILITPNAVNLSFSETNSVLFESLKKNFEGFKVIGFVGSIFPYHGVDKLINGFAQLIGKNPREKAKLLIVGDGEILNQLKELVITLNLKELVIFTGNVPHKEVSNYIELMDVTVIADSKWYCSPVKIFEYGLFGKYIIAPNTQSVRDVMEHKKHGWLVDGTEEDLINALEFALNYPKESKMAGLAFQEKVKNEHLWNNVGDSIYSRME